MKLFVGEYYNRKNQPERLVYLGKKGIWHQFAKVNDRRDVWSEVLDQDLGMFEVSKEEPPKPPLHKLRNGGMSNGELTVFTSMGGIGRSPINT